MTNGTIAALASSPGGEGGAVDHRFGWIAHRDLNLALVVGAVAFVAYLLTLSRGVLGGDAGELQFVPPILGLTHPTGYPLQVLLHFTWSFVPIGSVAYRQNLLDGLIAATAVGVVVALTRQLGVSRKAASLAGFSLAFGELWWSQAVRGDKYTLNGLFLALVLLLFLRWRSSPTPRRLAILGFIYGLSLAHHRSMLLVAPALGVGLLLFSWRPVPLRNLGLPVLLCLAPLVLYAYVPWAGARGLPPGSWPVDTPSAFAEFLMDRGYTSQIRPDAAFGGRLTEEAWVLIRSFGPLGAALGLTGAASAFRRGWRVGLVLLLVFLPQAILGASYVLESNYQFPRHWVFYLPGFLVWSVWIGLGLEGVVAGVIRALPSRPPLLMSSLFAMVLLTQAGTAWARGAVQLVRAEAGAETMDAWRQDLQRSPVAERFGRLAMDLAVENAIIVCDWEQATVLWYFQRVEGMRPDLTIRYPIERLDETLTEARTTGQTVYISRTLPGVESRGIASSAGPLIQVFPLPQTSAVRGGIARFEPALRLVSSEIHASRRGQAGPAMAPVEENASTYRGLPLQPGGVVPFTLYWLADAPLTEAFAISVRLIGPDGATVAAEDERHPVLGTSPTNHWPVGQLIGDYHELPLGSRLAPGNYRIQVQPYRVDPVANLRRLDATAHADDGASIPITVIPRSLGRPLDLLASLVAR